MLLSISMPFNHACNSASKICLNVHIMCLLKCFLLYFVLRFFGNCRIFFFTKKKTKIVGVLKLMYRMIDKVVVVFLFLSVSGVSQV